MVKKIQIIEVIEHIYEPDPEDYEGEIDGDYTIEKALELDMKDIDKKVTMTDLAQESKVINRVWRIIDEP